MRESTDCVGGVYVLCDPVLYDFHLLCLALPFPLPSSLSQRDRSPVRSRSFLWASRIFSLLSLSAILGSLRGFLFCYYLSGLLLHCFLSLGGSRGECIKNILVCRIENVNITLPPSLGLSPPSLLPPSPREAVMTATGILSSVRNESTLPQHRN